MGVYHRQYRGNAYCIYKRLPNKFPVDSRIIINTVFFQEANPYYTMLYIEKSDKKKSLKDNSIFFFNWWSFEEATRSIKEERQRFY